MRVKSTYARYSQVRASRGVTADQVARLILDMNGLRDVPIQRIAGSLTDHYDVGEGGGGENAAGPLHLLLAEDVPALQGHQRPVAGVVVIFKGISSTASPAGPFFLCRQKEGKERPRGFMSRLSRVTSARWLALNSTGRVTSWNTATSPNSATPAMARPEEFSTSPMRIRGTYVAALVQSLAQLLRLLILVGGTRRRD